MLSSETKGVSVSDPVCDARALRKNHGIQLVELTSISDVDALVVAVPHEHFKELSLDTLKNFFSSGSPRLIFDIKNTYAQRDLTANNFHVKSL